MILVTSSLPSGSVRRLRSGISEITSPVTSYVSWSVRTQQRIAVWYRSSSQSDSIVHSRMRWYSVPEHHAARAAVGIARR